MSFHAVHLPAKYTSCKFVAWTGGPSAQQVDAVLNKPSVGLIRDNVVQELPSDAGFSEDLLRAVAAVNEPVDIEALRSLAQTAPMATYPVVLSIDGKQAGLLVVDGFALLSSEEQDKLNEMALSVPEGTQAPGVVSRGGLRRAPGPTGQIPAAGVKRSIFQKIRGGKSKAISR